jgi:hypothetical protein
MRTSLARCRNRFWMGDVEGRSQSLCLAHRFAYAPFGLVWVTVGSRSNHDVEADSRRHGRAVLVGDQPMTAVVPESKPRGRGCAAGFRLEEARCSGTEPASR